MANLLRVPLQVTNEVELRRFLTNLLVQLDQIIGLPTDITGKPGELPIEATLYELNQRIITLPEYNEVTKITASATYTQTELQELADQVSELSQVVAQTLNILRS